MNEPNTVTIDDWLFRINPANHSNPAGVLVACHGWTGNEFSMDIFIRSKLSNAYTVIFPRAPYGTAESGFSWVEGSHGHHQNVRELELSAIGLQRRITAICVQNSLHDLPQLFMGFSQGAALVLAYSLLFSTVGSRYGLLSGFLPEGLQAQPGSLIGRRYFVAHGISDPIVPIAHAREAVQFLETGGASVDYCEADTGHKLHASCFKQLENFLL
jgi:predicted esterase